MVAKLASDSEEEQEKMVCEDVPCTAAAAIAKANRNIPLARESESKTALTHKIEALTTKLQERQLQLQSQVQQQQQQHIQLQTQLEQQ